MSGTVDGTRVLRIAALLVARRQTLGVSEASAGGLVSAALLAVPGASAFYLGGAVIYTGISREALLGIPPEALGAIRSSTEPMAALLARTIRAKLGAEWGLSETGAAGPSGNRYGDAAGHCCLSVSGPRSLSRTIATGSADRAENMVTFADAALALLEQALTLPQDGA